MDLPKVSVVIPSYNQAGFLAEAVQSVLDQTYSNFEVIVINDASTDNTDEVMSRFNDPRIKYIVHKENRYAAAARNTGIRAASGELISFLDADDIFHPEKLQVQVAFLDGNPATGLTYNSRIEIDETGLPLSIVKTPPVATLSDLVMDYPYAPSEVVMRKDWAFRVGLFDESYVFHGEDPDFHMRLALQGCKMEGVDRVLNYRRFHTGRVFHNLAGVVAGEIRAFENTFADPRCPPEVLALREKSLGKIYMILSYYAFVQNETVLGQDLIRKAIKFDRSILDVEANKFLRFLIMTSTRDGGNHEIPLRRVFAQIPPELDWITQHLDSTLAYGYLLKGTRDIMWGRIEDGRDHLASAAALGAHIEEPFLQTLTAQLLNYEEEFGQGSVEDVLENLSASLQEAGYRHSARRLQGCYAINKAFQDYRLGQYKEVIPNTLQSILYNPTYLSNRGVLSILSHSLIGSMKNKGKP
jgi:glycosyltransferase involved in cell wall biosynthesis